MFMGEYNYSIDDKNRLTIPSKLRECIGGEFVLTKGIDNCLVIYPKDSWNKIIDKYKDLPNTKDVRNFMRLFLSSASACLLDKQGRFNIGSSLIMYAGINKDCTIIGVGDHLEIWSKENWEKFINNSGADLSSMVDNIFTGV